MATDPGDALSGRTPEWSLTADRQVAQRWGGESSRSSGAMDVERGAESARGVEPTAAHGAGAGKVPA
ncbi:hypothetical protein [Saccharothrix xinjiangensis]|uniref:Uncharacterized protein n=1 Tax=Saccharothrix xinjiangensis TaxID=204798 RepID=A0ABV9YF69_9PSEU